MNKGTEIFYTLTAFSFMAAFGCYYWIAKYILESGNHLRHEFITGFMMVASLSSPLWAGIILIALFRFRKLKKNEIIIAFSPAIAILAGFTLLMLMRN